MHSNPAFIPENTILYIYNLPRSNFRRYPPALRVVTPQPPKIAHSSVCTTFRFLSYLRVAIRVPLLAEEHEDASFAHCSCGWLNTGLLDKWSLWDRVRLVPILSDEILGFTGGSVRKGTGRLGDSLCFLKDSL